MGFGWRLRICTMAMALAMYLSISAMISVSSIHGSPGSGAANSHTLVQTLPEGPQHGAGRSLNGAPVVQKSQGSMSVDLTARGAGRPRITPRRLRSRFGPSIDWCKQLRYKPVPGPVTALASFPGSGNTWLRYLIQQATGTLTGSVYKDYALLKNGFPAESVTNGSVIAVKTHEFGPDSVAAFDRALLLVRDPFASLQAEFNRRSGGHVGHASLEKYRRNNGKYWHNFVMSKGTEWERMNLAWFDAFAPADRLIVRYEDLIEHTEDTLRTVLTFLGGDVEGVECAISRREGIYKRSKKTLNFEVFDADMRRHLVQRRVSLFSKMGLAVPVEDVDFLAREEKDVKMTNRTTTPTPILRSEQSKN